MILWRICQLKQTRWLWEVRTPVAGAVNWAAQMWLTADIHMARKMALKTTCFFIFLCPLYVVYSFLAAFLAKTGDLPDQWLHRWQLTRTNVCPLRKMQYEQEMNTQIELRNPRALRFCQGLAAKALWFAQVGNGSILTCCKLEVYVSSVWIELKGSRARTCMKESDTVVFLFTDASQVI
jgi:hypothetical protein